MKRKILKIIGIIVLVAITGANGWFLYYTYKHPKQLATAGHTLAFAPKASLTIKSAKQHDVDTSQQGKYLSSGDYAYDSLDVSRVDGSAGSGSLVLATYPTLGANFVLATAKDTVIDSTTVADGWQTKTISTDPLWAPGACSSKPTLLLKGRYIFIDDGKTNPTDAYSSYIVFDMQTGKYNYFGGDKYTDTQAKHEHIMLATDENDQLVFYIDQSDTSGPLADSAAFKHNSDHAKGYIVRRVIDPATMHFSDYKIPYSLSGGDTGTQYYYLTAYSQGNTTPTLGYQLDGGTDTYEGQVLNNAITFQLKPAQQTLAVNNGAGPNGKYDTDLERKLNDTLTKALPDFKPGNDYYKTNYDTSFGVNEIGQHNGTDYIIATTRGGEAETPAIVDSSGKVYPLTTKPTLVYNSYVSLGVF